MGEHGGPGDRPAWSGQSDARERVLREFITTFTDLIEAGEPLRANLLVRETALGEIVVHGKDLHRELAARLRPSSFETLLTPDQPGLLLVLAIARSEATGTVTALAPMLRQGARLLLARQTASVGVRARNLSLAAYALYLAGDEAASRDIGHRASQLILSVEPGAVPPDAKELAAAASDLALNAILVEGYHDAVALWEWVRARFADPTNPALMQADWGLSIAGAVMGDRTLISPLAQPMLSPEESADGSLSGDPWWALLQTARAWCAIDRLDAERALAITSRTLTQVTNPRRNAPLVSIHAIALAACGQGAAAADFLERHNDVDLTEASGARSWRVMLAIVGAATSGGDARTLIDAPALADDRAMRTLARGYAWLVAGQGDPAEHAIVEPGPDRSLRVHAFVYLVRAAVDLRRGNEAAALAMLERVDVMHASRGMTGWALLLPDEDVAAMRALAFRSQRDALAASLPEHTAVHAVQPPIELTEREREVLHLLQRGNTNAQIAAKLFISPNTVKFHVANILKRLGVASREEAAASGGGGLRRREDGPPGRAGRSGG